MAEAIPGARLVTIPEAGHVAPLENHEATNAAILEFLEGALVRSPTAGSTALASRSRPAAIIRAWMRAIGSPRSIRSPASALDGRTTRRRPSP